jgi:predicted RNA-binding Zn-ribbon protein involved in translation (DUF1610 family)
MRARELLMATPAATEGDMTRLAEKTPGNGEREIQDQATYVCPDCGAPMIVIDIFARRQLPRAPPINIGA